MRRFLVAAAAAALVLAPTAASAQSDDAEVVAVHGIPESVLTGLGAPDSEVDVYVADSYDAPLFSFSFGDVETLNVPAGSYTLEVYVAGSDAAAEEPVLELGPADLAAGSSTSVVAQLNEAGDTPSLAAYGNQTDGTGIQVFHSAAFGPVDVYAGGEIALEGAANGDTARVDVPGGTTVPDVGIAPTGDEVALPVGDVEVPEDTLVLAYAVGDAETLQVVTATVGAQAADDGTEDDGTDEGTEDDGTDDAGTEDDGTDGAAGTGDETTQTPVPSGVHAGSAGLASSTGSTVPLLLLLAGGLLLLAAPVTAAVRSRR